MIVLRDVSRRFGAHQAVRDVSLTVEPGQIFGIIGPNGAGKSTLFRLICQIIRPDSGTITVNGASDEIAIKRQVGYLPEEHRLYEHLRTLDYLHYFCDLQGLPRARALEVLTLVELEHRARDKISTLSKGMRQKLVFGRTLLGDPAALVLDEPTYGLDPSTSQQVRGWIRHEAEEKMVMMSSHNLHEAERVCDRIAIIHHGRIVARGTPRALIEQVKQEHILEIGFQGPEPRMRAALSRLPASRPPVFEVSLVRLYFSRTHNPYELLQSILKAIHHLSDTIAITGITPREATLEDVFLEVTGEVYVEADEKGATDTGMAEAG